MLSSKIQKKIAAGKGSPSKAEIEKYYKENPSRFGTPEKRNVLVILTKGEAEAKKAKKEIESGKSFASVAKSNSIDPTSKAKGGLLTGVVKGQEEAALNTAIFSAPLNKLSGPVKTPFGYYIYEVKSSTPGNQQTLKQSEASIKQQLTATQQQTALSKFVKEFKKTWTAKTDCRSGIRGDGLQAVQSTQDELHELNWHRGPADEHRLHLGADDDDYHQIVSSR